MKGEKMKTYKKLLKPTSLVKTHATTFFVVLALLWYGTGTAEGLIVVDPDAFTDGTDVSNAFPGVTLSALGNYDNADSKVYARADSLASTGDNVFGTNWWGDPEWGFDTSFQPHLRVDFSQLVMSVSIDAIGNNSQDYGRLEAYDSTDVLLDDYETSLLTVGDVESMTVSTASPSISYILAAGKDPGVEPHHTILLDNLSYVVPEPATIALLGLGSLALLRRRR
jgi:hypothetical protein